MRSDNVYDYSSAGFDGFLSRSIDSLSQNNLDSQGPQSTAIRYDSSQMTGALGDIWRIGDLQLNGRDGAIETIEERSKPLLLGKDSQGNNVLKIAPLGIDAATASDDELLFNSRSNVVALDGRDNPAFKYEVTAADISNTYFQIQFLHQLDFTPEVNASFCSTGFGFPSSRRFSLPFMWLSNISYFNEPPSATMAITGIDEKYIYVSGGIHDVLGLSFFASNNKLLFRFECRRPVTSTS